MTHSHPTYLLDTTVLSNFAHVRRPDLPPIRFLSDDFAARRLAEAKGLTVSGTIGILLKGMAAGALALPAADRLLAEMIAHGYRAPVRSLRELTAG